MHRGHRRGNATHEFLLFGCQFLNVEFDSQNIMSELLLIKCSRRIYWNVNFYEHFILVFERKNNQPPEQEHLTFNGDPL